MQQGERITTMRIYWQDKKSQIRNSLLLTMKKVCIKGKDTYIDYYKVQKGDSNMVE